MKFVWIVLVLGLFAVSASAQTVIISDTGTASWTPSPDNDLIFGTPLVTGYKGEFFLKTAVTGGVPSGTAAITADFGKPAIVAGVQKSPFLKPLMQPNTEYVLFLSAVGPGGSSARTGASVPFGFPGPPKPVGTPATITP